MLLTLYSALVLAVSAAVAVFVITVLSSPRPSFSDRLAEAGDWLAAGTLALAAIAGLVALQAYAAATGLPRLQLRLEVGASDPNLPVLGTEDAVRGEGSTIFWGMGFGFGQIRISLNNASAYSARNPPLSCGWTQ